MYRRTFFLATVCLAAAGCTPVEESIPPTRNAISEIHDLQDSGSASSIIQSSDGEADDGVVPRGTFQAEFVTTDGKFTVEVHRDWAPIGADRFYQLVKDRFFDDAAFFRVVENFVVQFGLPADPARNAKWSRNLKDERVITGNKRGYLTFAKAGPNSRTTQLFINLQDNHRLDADGFAAFGEIIEGMEVVDRLNSEYGGEPSNHQDKIREQGNAFLQNRYPNLSYIQTARITVDDLTPATDSSEAPGSN